MGIKNTHGFTIIEVMLFLAVSGLLAVGILASSGMAINQQRYRDSVDSLKSVLQEQYSQTANTTNSRSGDESCTNAVVTRPPDDVSNPQARGTSRCLLMGRLLVIGADGKQITTSNVVGYRTSLTADEEATGIEELKQNYVLGVSKEGQVTDEVEWGARVVEPGTATAYPLSAMVIRSPLSGSVMTFVKEDVQTDLNAMVADGVVSDSVDMCVAAAPGTFGGYQMAVRIGAYAASQSAIEIMPESDGICD